MPYELFLTIREKTKTRKAFANNISTDIKFSKAQISKIIQSHGSYASWLGNFGQNAQTNIAIYFARDNLLGFVSHINPYTNLKEK